MKEKWTPGPWWSDGWYDPDECGCSILAANTYAGPLPGNPTRGQVGWATSLLADPEEAATCKANAHLMAAAPDLYEALRNLRKLNADAAASGYTDHAALHALYEGNAVASAALSKARGDSQ